MCRRKVITLLAALTIAQSCATSGRRHQQGPTQNTAVSYPSTGAGHYIKAVDPNGQSVTLEDGSVWELDPAAWFFTVNWQPLDNVTVRRTESDTAEHGGVGPQFNYEIDNIDQDKGAPARYTPH